MNYCNMPNHGLNFRCESHVERVNRDIKELTEKTGFDFLYFAPFMSNNHDYAVSWYPNDLIDKDGFKFNACLHSGESAWLIQCENKETKLTNYQNYRYATDNWLTEMDRLEAQAEKDEMRKRLQSVGINPIW